MPATKNGSISTIRYFLSVAGARNIRKLANKKYPSDLPSPPRRISGSRFKRDTRLAFSPKRKLVIDTATRSKKRERESLPVHPFRCWASIKTYFAGGPSDVNNLALVSFVIIAVTSIWREKFRARGRGGVSFDTVWNR